jgi:hypothetical protein
MPVTAAPLASVSGNTFAVSSLSRAAIPTADAASATVATARRAAVAAPVATTTARALPATMVAPSNTMPARSPNCAPGV